MLKRSLWVINRMRIPECPEILMPWDQKIYNKNAKVLEWNYLGGFVPTTLRSRYQRRTKPDPNTEETLVANLSTFAQFRYLKDLPNMLFRILQGPQQTDRRKAQRTENNSYFARKGAATREAKTHGTLKPREERIAVDLLEGKKKSAATRVSRRKKLMEDAWQALKRYSNDSQYQ
ncbi:hypothetical protein SUGI_0276700 [Cryptomeria japonica]|nr:hypothetical protein SUGI_0276700 [Cryptomeria japonica]